MTVPPASEFEAWYADEARRDPALAALQPRWHAEGWQAPDAAFVTIEDGAILWRRDATLHDVEVAPYTVMRSFISLADAGPDRVLAFAREHGPLGYPNADGIRGRLIAVPEKADTNDVLSAESLEGWSTLAKQARAFLSLANRLHDNRVGDSRDWEALRVRSDAKVRDPRFRDVGHQRSIFTALFHQWTVEADASLHLWWWDPVPTVSLAGTGLFTSIVIGMAGAMLRSDRLVVCAICNELFSQRPHAARRYPPHCPKPFCQHELDALRHRSHRAAKRERLARTRAGG